MKHECSGCPHWKWHKRDNLYGTPGFHRCDEPDFCERFRKKKIHRDERGVITDECLKDMLESLPIDLFIYKDNYPHDSISTAEGLEKYFFGALPYALTTYYRSRKEEIR